LDNPQDNIENDDPENDNLEDGLGK